MSLPFAGCPVCESLSEGMLAEIDALLMSDPATWPVTLFEGMEPPPGLITPRWRRWGACRMAKAWLLDRGIDLPLRRIDLHYQSHLPKYPSYTDDLMEQGQLSNGEMVPTAPSAFLGASDYRKFFDQGISLGREALEELKVRLHDRHNPMTTTHLVTIARLAAQLAAAQQAAMARAGAFNPSTDDDITGFMGGGGPRFGQSRVKVVDGEATIVNDGSMTDWTEANRKAFERGEDRQLD